MTKPKLDTSDWANLPIEMWNCTTFTAYLVHLTQERCGVTYEPTGRGPKHQRWLTEKGMMKNAQGTYGNAVLKRFIELCFDKHTPKPRYPYPSFTFMYSYMSDLFPVAQSEIARSKQREVIAAETKVDEIDEEWF